MKQFCFLLLLTLRTSALYAQQNKELNFYFQAIFGDKKISPSTDFYRLNERDSIEIETLKFYISGLKLTNKNKLVWQESNSYHLIDFANEKSCQLTFIVPALLEFDALSCNFGIDSITNVSGAMGGDLDPTKGMYWTWQSGYINFKLEGKSNLCSTRKNEFQFHLGGYQYPYKALQTMQWKFKSGAGANFVFDLGQFINQIDLRQVNKIMSPSKEAIQLSEKAVQAFKNGE
jgi:hypothetical protein